MFILVRDGLPTPTCRRRVLARPGQASTKHRRETQEELYLLLEGRGRIRIDEDSLELGPLDTLVVEPDTVRQIFNDTDEDALWFVAGTPPVAVSSTLEMSEEMLRAFYPDGPRALPPELGGGRFEPLDGPT
jgi:quercetin dioxygenase-like cupin family protein